MIVPWNQLQPATLRALVEEFVSREGTDYGERELSFETKIGHVMKQLEDGTIAVVFDAKTETCDLREVKSLHRAAPPPPALPQTEDRSFNQDLPFDFDQR